MLTTFYNFNFCYLLTYIITSSVHGRIFTFHQRACALELKNFC